MMSSAESPFIRAIIEHPDDDGPRLLYADHLDENGDCDRAEFIRLQCDQARLDAVFKKMYGIGINEFRRWSFNPLNKESCDIVSKWHEIDCRLHKLTDGDDCWKWAKDDLGDHWCAKWPHSAGIVERPATRVTDGRLWATTWHSCHVKYRRGFIEDVTCPSDAWLGVCDDLTTRAPVQRVTLTTPLEVQVRNQRHDRRIDYFIRYGDNKLVYFSVDYLGYERSVRGSHIEMIRDQLLRIAWPRIRFTNPSPVAGASHE